MLIPFGTLLVIILVAFMLGMLTSFILVVNAMLRDGLRPRPQPIKKAKKRHLLRLFPL